MWPYTYQIQTEGEIAWSNVNITINYYCVETVVGKVVSITQANNYFMRMRTTS